MLTWILGLWSNPLTRKYIIYAVAILAICSFIGYKVYSYGSRVWDDSQRQEYLRGRKEAEDLNKAREKTLQAEIDAEKKINAEGQAKNDADHKLLAAQKDELLRARHLLELSAARIEAKAVAGIDAGYKAGQSLTGANAAAAITALSRELEADHNWRSRTPGPADPK